MLEQDFENPRLWEEEKPFLKDFFVPYSVYDSTFHERPLRGEAAPLDPCCASCREPGDRVTLCVYIEDESWRDAWDSILANADKVEEALSAKLRAVNERNLKQHFEENLPGMRQWQKHWDFILSQVGADPETLLSRMFKLTGVSIVRSDPEGEWVVGFEFQTGWDMDHGLEILMWGHKVLTSAGMLELTSTGRSPIMGAKVNQEYELDPGDYVLS